MGATEISSTWSQYTTRDDVMRIEGMTAEECDNEIEREIGSHTRWVVRMALIVRRRFEVSGEYPPIRPEVCATFMKVAYGQVHPEAVSRFLIAPKLLERVCRLPLPDQEAFATKPLKIVVLKNGEWHERVCTEPANLLKSDLDMIFVGDRIRSRAEQIAYAEQRLACEKVLDVDPDEAVSMRIVIPLKERKKIAKAARDRGIAEGDMVLLALRQAKVIK